jgi:L-alanine-DL-glutamate epimerase-like enolase superfamily enzyme
MALLDLAGKAYGVPVYQLAGGKFRDKVRCYCDSEFHPDPNVMVAHLRDRMARGFTFLKMDVGLILCAGTPEYYEQPDGTRVPPPVAVPACPGTVCAPDGVVHSTKIMHPFTGIQLTPKGIDRIVDWVAAVREGIGYEVPLAADHFGHLGLEACIRLARALDRFNLAWYEDMVPWQFADQYRRLSESCTTPICTGEDIYLKEGFAPLFAPRAIAVAHPDLMTAGGILETKKIADLAAERGIALALHMAGTPVAALASIHCAAACENFLDLENHSVDVPWWDDLVTGLPKPIVQQGHIAVPETPGLGIELNPDVVQAHLDPKRPGYFAPTTEWDVRRAHDRLWS